MSPLEELATVEIAAAVFCDRCRIEKERRFNHKGTYRCPWKSAFYGVADGYGCPTCKAFMQQFKDQIHEV